MRQVNLLPSGSHPKRKNILHATEDRLYYASTLALHVINARTFAFEKIIALSDQNLMAIAINPHDSNRMLCVCKKGNLTHWNLATGLPISTYLVKGECRYVLEWDPFNSDLCLLGFQSPDLQSKSSVSMINMGIHKDGIELSEMYTMKDFHEILTVIRLNTLINGLFAVGCNNGVVYILTSKSKSGKERLLKNSDRNSSVVDMRWDRLSSIYILVAYDKCVSLWDSEAASEMHSFDRQVGYQKSMCSL